MTAEGLLCKLNFPIVLSQYYHPQMRRFTCLFPHKVKVPHPMARLATWHAPSPAQSHSFKSLREPSGLARYTSATLSIPAVLHTTAAGMVPQSSGHARAWPCRACTECSPAARLPKLGPLSAAPQSHMPPRSVNVLKPLHHAWNSQW